MAKNKFSHPFKLTDGGIIRDAEGAFVCESYWSRGSKVTKADLKHSEKLLAFLNENYVSDEYKKLKAFVEELDGAGLLPEESSNEFKSIVGED